MEDYIDRRFVKFTSKVVISRLNLTCHSLIIGKSAYEKFKSMFEIL